MTSASVNLFFTRNLLLEREIASKVTPIWTEPGSLDEIIFQDKNIECF